MRLLSVKNAQDAGIMYRQGSAFHRASRSLLPRLSGARALGKPGHMEKEAAEAACTFTLKDR